MPCWKVILEYEGTKYSGWQEQKNSRTVSGELRKAAERVLRTEVQIDGAGRTDAGVHALAQVARLKAARPLAAARLLTKLNQELPRDINMLSVQETSCRFHPRHDAISRQYIYQISTRRTAFAKSFVWWIRDEIDVKRMQAASGFLVGRHDYDRFSDKRAEDASTIVVVERAEVIESGALILFRIAASHYLWKMVRRIVGCLVQVGLGKLTPEEFALLIAPQPLPLRLANFSIAANTAPASGLFLERVVYDEEEDVPPVTVVFPVLRFS